MYAGLFEDDLDSVASAIDLMMTKAALVAPTPAAMPHDPHARPGGSSPSAPSI